MKQVIVPGAARRYAPPRRWQFDSMRIYVRPRTGPLSAHLWWPAVAKLQAASVPIAKAGTDRQTDRDGSQYHLMPPYGGGHNEDINGFRLLL